MKKTTSKKISNQLTKYGALTAALIGVTDASGQILYTNIDPDFAGDIGDEFFLDLNQDAVNDFRIQQSGDNLFIEPLSSNSILGSINFNSSSNNSYAYPFALSSGDVISSGQTSWAAFDTQSLNFGSYSSSSSSSSPCSYGNWCDETDKFLGLRFIVNGNTHYGWARLDAVFTNGWTVKDFAYNTIPDASIEAGQQTLSIESNNLDDIRIVAINKTIGLYNLTDATEYTLFDIKGKQVLTGKNDNVTSTVIEANKIASGIYILELNSINSNAVIRKKIVL